MSQSIIESFIRDYGYWAILIGTFLEGETVVIIGGLFAHLGLLELPYVILSAFIGGFSGDQLYYFIGYFRGRELFARHPKWQNHADKALRRVEQYHNAIILGFRFVYGMRMIFPFVMGTWKKVRKTQFILPDCAATALWAATVSAGGYFFGYALKNLIADLRKYELYVAGFIILIGMIVWIMHIKRIRN